MSTKHEKPTPEIGSLQTALLLIMMTMGGMFAAGMFGWIMGIVPSIMAVPALTVMLIIMLGSNEIIKRL